MNDKTNKKPRFAQFFLTQAVIFIFFSAFAIFSCAPSASIIVNQNNSIEISAKNTASQELNSIAKNMTKSNSNGNSPEAVFSQKEIQNLLKEIGINSNEIKIENAIDFSVEKVKISEKQIQNDEDLSNSFSVSKISDTNIFKLTLDPDYIFGKADENEDLQDILEMLMAPVYTREDLSSDEYIECIASFYGKKTATKFKNSNFVIEIQFPSKIKSYSISKEEHSFNKVNATIKSDENKATIIIPIYKFLCKDEPTSFTIEY